MTLNVTATKIEVKNASGGIKFTSDNKLIYQRKYQTGTLGLNGNTSYVTFDSLGPKDFLVLSIKINSASGEAGIISPLIGKDIPANGSTIIDFYGRNVNNQAGVDSEMLCVDLISNVLWFKTVRFNNLGIMSSGTTTLNVTYTARILSYL